jgi:hypothetical protein
VEAVASWERVTAEVGEALVGQSFEAAGRTVHIAEVRLGGVGDGRIFVELGLRGDVHGLVYLVGTPAYDAASDELRVPDLDFEVAARNALVEGAAWLVEEGFPELIRSRARWSVAPAREWALEKVNRGFNARVSNRVRLEGVAESVAVERVIAGPDELRIRASVQGRARLHVETPKPSGG